jgi:hypothetical protein
VSAHYVTLPNGKRCGLGVYVAAWRTILSLAPDTMLPGFDHFPSAARDVLRDLRNGMHDRINRHVPGFGKGRKWDQDWQRGAIQCAHAVNTPRLIVRWVPADLRARLSHRLATEE